MEFNFETKVTGTGSFTPPPGYQLIDDEWVKISDVFDKSVTVTSFIKEENDMDEQQTPEGTEATAEAATAEAATAECTTTESACSATAESTEETTTESTETTE